MTASTRGVHDVRVGPFYPRDAMLARSLRQRRVCPSVRPSGGPSHAGIVPERKQDREMYTVW